MPLIFSALVVRVLICVVEEKEEEDQEVYLGFLLKGWYFRSHCDLEKSHASVYKCKQCYSRECEYA